MNIFFKFKSKLKEKIIFFLVKISLIFSFPYLGTLALALARKKINEKGEYTILCLGRSIFLDDVKALSHYGRKLKYLSVHLGVFLYIFEYYFTQPEREKLTESNYHVEDYCREAKDKYFSFLKKLLPQLKKILKFDAVLSGNYSYIMQQEIARACRENNIPFLVSFKEGLVVPGSYGGWSEIQKGCEFIGNKMMVYNENIKKSFLEAKIKGLNENNLIICGIPRLDQYFINNEKKSFKKQIVFFSYYPSIKFAGMISDQKKFEQALKRSDDFHKWVMTFALKHPEIKVIIKTKVSEHFVNYVESIYKKNFTKPINNLKITNSGDTYKLITESDAIITFYSTTVMEALIADKIVITPYFGDLITDKPWDFFPGYEDLVNYVKEEGELEKNLSKGKIKYDQQRKAEFLKQFIYIPDGKASVRVEEEIIKIIEKKK